MGYPLAKLQPQSQEQERQFLELPAAVALHPTCNGDDKDDDNGDARTTKTTIRMCNDQLKPA
jgi:hypothetical protein